MATKRWGGMRVRVWRRHDDELGVGGRVGERRERLGRKWAQRIRGRIPGKRQEGHQRKVKEKSGTVREGHSKERENETSFRGHHKSSRNITPMACSWRVNDPERHLVGSSGHQSQGEPRQVGAPSAGHVRVTRDGGGARQVFEGTNENTSALPGGLPPQSPPGPREA